MDIAFTAFQLYSTDAHVVCFVDNNVTLGSLVRGSSHLHAMTPIVHAIWEGVAQSTGRICWWERVDSASNGSDAPSRMWEKGSYSFSGGYGERVYASRRAYGFADADMRQLVNHSLIDGVPAILNFRHA